jgi:hypothetical protein
MSGLLGINKNKTLNGLTEGYFDNSYVVNETVITENVVNETVTTLNVVNENVSGNLTLTGANSVFYSPTMASNNCIVNGLTNNGNENIIGTLAVGGTSTMANISCNTVNASNVISNMANLTNIGSTNAAISTINCSTLNGVNASFYDPTSSIQSQINAIVNSASVGGGGYFVMTAEASVMSIGNNYCFGASQANGFLYNVMPTCTLIGFALNCQTVLTTALKVDVKKNGILLYRNSIAIGLNQIYASNISYGFTAGDTLQLYISTAGLPNANPSRITLIFMTNGITGPQGLSSSVTIGSTSTLTAGSSATVTNVGTSLNPIFNFGIPCGIQGNSITGAQGASSNISIGSTSTLTAGSSATVTNVGTSLNPIFNFGIPQGIQGNSITGAQGASSNITIGSISTLSAGLNATVTNTGTSLNPIFNFGIPKGESITGTNGIDGQSSSITIGTTTNLASGSIAYVTNVGTSLNPILNFGLVSGKDGKDGKDGSVGSIGHTGSTGSTGPAGPAGSNGMSITDILADVTIAALVVDVTALNLYCFTTLPPILAAYDLNFIAIDANLSTLNIDVPALKVKTTDMSYGLTSTNFARSVTIGSLIDFNSTNGKIICNNLQLDNLTIDSNGNINTTGNIICNNISSNQFHSYDDSITGLAIVDIGIHAIKINVGSFTTNTTNIEGSTVNIGVGSILNTVNIGNVFSTVNITGISGSAIQMNNYITQF